MLIFIIKVNKATFNNNKMMWRHGMGSNEDESIEELEHKVKYYNRKLYRIVMIGCLSQLIGFCLYSYLNNYVLVFMAIPLFIIAMISLVLFYFLSNKSIPLKIELYKISKREEKMLKADSWEYFVFYL